MQAAYLYVQHEVIDQDPELVTSLRYLTQVTYTYKKRTQVNTKTHIPTNKYTNTFCYAKAKQVNTQI